MPSNAARNMRGHKSAVGAWPDKFAPFGLEPQAGGSGGGAQKAPLLALQHVPAGVNRDSQDAGGERV